MLIGTHLVSLQANWNGSKKESLKNFGKTLHFQNYLLINQAANTCSRPLLTRIIVQNNKNNLFLTNLDKSQILIIYPIGNYLTNCWLTDFRVDRWKLLFYVRKHFKFRTKLAFWAICLTIEANHSLAFFSNDETFASKLP